MEKISKKSLHVNKDFLELDLNNVKVVFSTATNNRSFNRYKEDGIENIKSIINEYGINDVKYLNQVHSDRVYAYKAGYEDIIDEEGDAIITSEKGVAIGVFTADCVPIIIVNEEKNVVAAIHSGWKGTINSITLRVLEKMTSDYSVDHKYTKVYIGPHIRQCCYEISEELKNEFLDKTGISEDVLFKDRNLSMEVCIIKDLKCAGVEDDNIYTLDLCTHCEENTKLHSYRGSSGTYGRLFSFIFIK